MATYKATYKVPPHIKEGLDDGTLVQVGGVIRERKTKRAIGLLREVYDSTAIVFDASQRTFEHADKAGEFIEKAQGIVEKAQGFVKQAQGFVKQVSGKGTEESNAASNVVSSLSSVQSNPASDTISSLSSVNQIATPLGVMNLAVSTMGFAVVLHRLGGIERQLKESQASLEAIDFKVDLSHYSKFRAALKFAKSAFSMEKEENRKSSAWKAIERLSDIEHFYTRLADEEISLGSPIAYDYLATLSLSRVTEVRCYLELEELGTAQQKLAEGLNALKPRYKKFIEILLTSNPAFYLHPKLKGEIDLTRLTRVFQWLDPSIKTERDFFELQRENLYELARSQDKWESSLPRAISASTNDSSLIGQSKKLLGAIPKNFSTFRKETDQLPKNEIFLRLLQSFSAIERMIEDSNRLETYSTEVETVQKLGIEFKDWEQIVPPDDLGEDQGDLIYIAISE